MFRLRAGYFPEKESSQSSPGLRARTRESRAVSLAIPTGAVPSERCAKIITAVLLNGPDHLLLQDEMRLGGSTYTVGGGRRPGEADSPCQGEMPRRGRGGRDHRSLRKCVEPYGRAATWVRPSPRRTGGRPFVTRPLQYYGCVTLAPEVLTSGEGSSMIRTEASGVVLS